MTQPGLEITRAPTWHGRLAQPFRRVVLRLVAPMMGRFLIAHNELVTANIELSRRLEDTQRRLDWATEEIAAANALVWDQVALSRRLAEIEDRIDSGRAQGEDDATGEDRVNAV